MNYERTKLEKLVALRKKAQDQLDKKKRILTTTRRGSEPYTRAAREAGALIAQIRELSEAINAKVEQLR